MTAVSDVTSDDKFDIITNLGFQCLCHILWIFTSFISLTLRWLLDSIRDIEVLGQVIIIPSRLVSWCRIHTVGDIRSEPPPQTCLQQTILIFFICLSFIWRCVISTVRATICYICNSIGRWFVWRVLAHNTLISSTFGMVCCGLKDFSFEVTPMWIHAPKPEGLLKGEKTILDVTNRLLFRRLYI